jgi:hypothetical protein
MKMKGMRPQTEGAGPHGRSFRKVGRLKLNMFLLTCCPVEKNPDLSSDFAIWQGYCPFRRSIRVAARGMSDQGHSRRSVGGPVISGLLQQADSRSGFLKGAKQRAFLNPRQTS